MRLDWFKASSWTWQWLDERAQLGRQSGGGRFELDVGVSKCALEGVHGSCRMTAIHLLSLLSVASPCKTKQVLYEDICKVAKLTPTLSISHSVAEFQYPRYLTFRWKELVSPFK